MTIRILDGDCRDVLATLPADSVHCMVTSPPYWGLRDYGIPATVWGGDAKCAHVWGEPQKPGNYNWGEYIVADGKLDAGHQKKANAQRSAFCQRCGAWRGAHGLEPTIDLYVRNAVEVFRAVRRVLRPDGTLWLNLGDSYASGGSGGYSDKSTLAGFTNPNTKGRQMAAQSLAHKPSNGFKPKDLCGIPWRVAFALQADGWWLRQDIIWAKPNPMPESVTDRCTKAHEYLFLLTKSARYYFDAEAIKEESAPDKNRGSYNKYADAHAKGVAFLQTKANLGAFEDNGSRNKRSVWTVATSPFPEAHFATFPAELIEPCIKAGTSEKGCCAKCGAPWEREVEKSGGTIGKAWIDPAADPLMRGMSATKNPGGGIGNALDDEDKPYTVKTLGWRPTCKCAAVVVPCTVLDCFGGAGTTGLVADRLQRNAILIELNPKYAEMARNRIFSDAPLFAGNCGMKPPKQEAFL